jgi:lipopolysaccharide export system protein LptC
MDEATPERKGLSANWAVREVDHLFHRAARYTRFVFYSKWSLAAIAMVLISMLMIWPFLQKASSGMRISFISTGDTKGKGETAASPTMNSPVYEGTDNSGQPFKITASRAVQVSPELVKVENVEGQLLLKNDNFASLTADMAEYRQEKHSIDLIGNVRVVHGNGYTFETPSARIDTETQDVDGTEQVTGEGPTGNLLATGFQIRENGSIIRFGGVGRVNVHIDRTK